MKKFFTLIFFTLAILASSNSLAEAVVVKGYAPIENMDVASARKEARKQALRAAVEAVVGVYVQSETEVADLMVVKDEISVKSDGYVTINKVLVEEARGNIFYVELDVEASAEKIRTFAQDLKSQIDANVNDSNSRGGIMLAVVQKNPNGSYSYETTMGIYLNEKLKLVGFKPVPNDYVSQYLLNHATDPDVSLKARALARETRDSTNEIANAILRGVLEIESVKKVSGVYEAVVKASFELIGIDSSQVDVFTKYVKGVAATEREAIENAKESATREAMDSLAKQALETVQNETRGGYINIKTAVVVENVTNYQAQYPLIKAGLENAKCKIIRMTRPSATTLAFFVSSDSYSNVGELQATLLSSIPGIQPGISKADELGASKIRLSF